MGPNFDYKMLKAQAYQIPVPNISIYARYKG